MNSSARTCLKKNGKFIEAVKSETEILFFIICINNYQKLMMHLNSIKKNVLQFFSDENLKEAVGKCFTMAINNINGNIDMLLDKQVTITYTEIRKVLISKLFKFTHKKIVAD